MSKKQSFKSDLSLAMSDQRERVIAAYNYVLAPLNRIDRSRLNGPSLAEYEAIGNELQGSLVAFDTQNPALLASVGEQVKQVKNLNAIRVAAFWALLVISLILLFVKFWVGIVLLVVAIVANIVVARIIFGRAKNAAHASQVLAQQAVAVLGTPETLESGATGLVARADNLFLVTLNDSERMMEQQRRQMEKQTAIQQRQHEAQMAAMQQQMEATKAVLNEQRAQNDALMGGNRGFIGNVIASSDRIKQDKKLNQ